MGTDQKGVSGKRWSGPGEGRLPPGEGGREEQQGIMSEGEGLRQGRERGRLQKGVREGGNSLWGLREGGGEIRIRDRGSRARRERGGSSQQRERESRALSALPMTPPFSAASRALPLSLSTGSFGESRWGDSQEGPREGVASAGRGREGVGSRERLSATPHDSAPLSAASRAVPLSVSPGRGGREAGVEFA